MNGAHWADYYADWLSRLVPEFDGMPVYVLSEAEIPSWLHCKGVIAWTSRNLDERLRPSLEDRGLWRGRGPAIVLCKSWFSRDEPSRLAILVHEAAHCVTWLGRLLTEKHRTPEDWTNLESILNTEGGDEFVLAKFRDVFGDEVDSFDAYARHLHHGLDFVRAGLHLWRRSSWQVSIDDVGLFSCLYQCAEARLAMDALADELDCGGDILAVLNSSPPKEFATLFECTESKRHDQ